MTDKNLYVSVRDATNLGRDCVSVFDIADHVQSGQSSDKRDYNRGAAAYTEAEREAEAEAEARAALLTVEREGETEEEVEPEVETEVTIDAEADRSKPVRMHRQAETETEAQTREITFKAETASFKFTGTSTNLKGGMYSGRKLLSDRGNSSLSQSGVFMVGARSLKLQLVANTKTGHYPRSMSLSIDGSVMVTGNQKGRSLSVFYVDVSTGLLTPDKGVFNLADSPSFVDIQY